jgi:hypothetical protein
MAETATPMPDPAGLPRTQDGTLVDQMESPPTGTPPPTTEGQTLLNKVDPNAPKTEVKPTDAPKPAEPKAPSGAPETYADYKVPEGFELDPTIKAEADKIFKGLNLSQEAAQSLVDFYTAKTAESAKQPYEAYKALTDEWREASLKHPEIGDKILPGGEINVRISRALDGLGDPQLAKDFRELMDLTGAGNNQAFIRVIDKLASRGVEGTHVGGRGPAEAGQRAPGQGPPTAARAMYPHLPSRNE